jgi:hypothetical protein
MLEGSGVLTTAPLKRVFAAVNHHCPYFGASPLGGPLADMIAAARHFVPH